MYEPMGESWPICPNTCPSTWQGMGAHLTLICLSEVGFRILKLPMRMWICQGLPSVATSQYVTEASLI